MSTHDPREIRDPQHLARLASRTRIQWKQAWFRSAHHGHLTPGGDHLVTVIRGQDGTWTVHPDPDAVFDLGDGEGRLTVDGRFLTAERAMRAAEDELAALLHRLAGAPRSVTR